MAVRLDGGCRVITLREGEPVRHGTVSVWNAIGRVCGARAISLRILECARGVSPGLRNRDCDEILYVLQGEATLYLDGERFEVGPDTGIYLAAGRTCTIDNRRSAPLVLAGSRCPEPEDDPVLGPGLTAPVPGAPALTAPPPGAAIGVADPTIRLWDQQSESTADRWYRVLVDQRLGSRETTQFVGSIPPGRAPDHYHHYEEVLCILLGEGRMWAGESSAPIAAGSCIYLPRGQVHCVENTGEGELRLLGVFHPAGSPAVRYDPD
jgi:mannose-6-phosphate isomerase-like protein (cupin superfamily)